MKAIAGALEPMSSTHAIPETECDRCCTSLRDESAQPVLGEAQHRWAARSLPERLHMMRAARHRMAAHPEAFAQAISPDLQRTQADTLVTELLPLLDAIRFLERRAHRLLRPRVPGRKGRPLWLGDVQAEVQRAPLGHVLVIGPSNFPLFLPGVQVLQALVAGNAVTWKPGAGGQRVALLVAHALRESGLPRGILCVTDESVGAAQTALAQRPDKVIFTGSFESGCTVLRGLAESATPAVMELSGSDAVVVLPSADLSLAAKAIAFGLRLNGAAVCMSPRRLVAMPETLRALRSALDAELAKLSPVALNERTGTTLRALLEDAIADGARVTGEFEPQAQRPLLVENARPQMRLTRSDLFAPVLSLIEAPSVLQLANLVNDCPYALTAAIFGAEHEARALGELLRVGTVLINDVIAPTADPRVPFGGRAHSGFGATRGAEGLLEMTAAKTVLVRRSGHGRHLQPVDRQEMPLFAGLIGALHGGSLRERLQSMRAVVRAARGR